jgi:tetratricopeptide (TPR) repeat protein
MRAQCLCILAVARVNLGEVRPGIEAAREATGIGRELKNEFVQAHAANNLVHGLTEAGEYEEALRVAREGLSIARGAPSLTLLLFQLVVLGNVFLAMLRLGEAHEAYLEALELADRTAPLRRWRSVIVPKLCASRALAGDWAGAHAYALESLNVRDDLPARLVWMDFLRYRETEALLRGGDEELAREDARRLGERVGNNPRFRLVFLRMLAVLQRWRGDAEGALGHLLEAQALAGEIGLPGELWQIHSSLGELHEELGDAGEAREAFARAVQIVQDLAGRIEDEELREGFLAAPQVRRVMMGPPSNG